MRSFKVVSKVPMEDIQVSLELTLRPANGLHLELKPRDPLPWSPAVKKREFTAIFQGHVGLRSLTTRRDESLAISPSEYFPFFVVFIVLKTYFYSPGRHYWYADSSVDFPPFERGRMKKAMFIEQWLNVVNKYLYIYDSSRFSWNFLEAIKTRQTAAGISECVF